MTPAATSTPIPTIAWHTLPVPDVIAQLNTDPQDGLSPERAAALLAQHGRNELVEAPRPTLLQRFLEQFNNFIVYILLFAIVVSFLLGDTIEAIAILAIVIFNAVLGVVQEGRAEQALSSLKKLAAPNAKVRRGGRTETIPAAELVIGDVVLLEAGDFIPADLRLTETVNMKIEEAALTGESVPTEKSADVIAEEKAGIGDRHNMAYMGTSVAVGRGRGVVVFSGMKTEMGKIAAELQNTEEDQTPLQKRLNQLGRVLSIGALMICAVIFVINVIPALQSGEDVVKALTDSFIVAISLAIAAVPEGLPAVVTINLAIGMREMIRRNALIRRLPAVETLGSTTIICSDKTGTLTQNQMTAVAAYADGEVIEITGEGYEPHGTFKHSANGSTFSVAEHKACERLLLGALLASDAHLDRDPVSHRTRILGDPTEGALVVAAAKANLHRKASEAAYPRVSEVPFDSARKRMTTIHQMQGTTEMIGFVKGAPEVILSLCTHLWHNGKRQPMTEEQRKAIQAQNSNFAAEALRVLAVAERLFSDLPSQLTPDNVEGELTFIGLIALRDPARPEIKPALEVARRAGIRTAMVTGDYPDTAKAIAKEIGLLRPDGEVMRGAEIEELSDEQLQERVDQVDVFARVSPHHKVRIVEAFQQRQQIVAMTGDGVNDAPALKRADIGVAMGITGTDVSKAAADMVLTDDNYASIVSAVEQGRTIYANIRKFVYYLLTCNLAEILVIFVGSLFGWGPPLTAIQLLWLNLVTDGAPALALGVEKGDPDNMKRPPRPANEPIIDKNMRLDLILQPIAIAVVTLVAFAIGHGEIRLEGFPLSGRLAHTLAFATLSIAQLFRAYTSRSELLPIFKIGFFSNKYMQYAVASSFIGIVLVLYVPFLQAAFDTVPLSLSAWVIILLLSIIPSLLAEFAKLYLRQRTFGTIKTN